MAWQKRKQTLHAIGNAEPTFLPCHPAAQRCEKDLQQIFHSEFASKGNEINSLNARLEKLEASDSALADDPQVQVQKVLKLLDQLEKLAEVPDARVRVNEVLKKLGIWIGLDFRSATWGKREVRRNTLSSFQGQPGNERHEPGV